MRSINHAQAESSIIDLVDALLTNAIVREASDIHLEPLRNQLRVRMRLDGILYDQNPIASDQMFQVVSRIKVLSHMNIAEKRLPQDGTFSLQVNNKQIDFRISTFPTIWGEKMVIRVLDTSILTKSLHDLGFNFLLKEQFIQAISKPQGFILVTGPTGSGKTTTLYAALSYLHRPEKNIITLEDPVEYTLAGITQGKINYDSGFNFQKGIRAILRQDPDILMVGEIRDRPTARTAIEASLTGHLVLSTLHTNDAASAITRLLDMEIEPFLLNASLTAVLAQRLVRRLCISCKKIEKLTSDEWAAVQQLALSIDHIHKPIGCSSCSGTGYKGRIGVFELLLITPSVRDLISSKASLLDITKQGIAEGLITLQQDGIKKVEDGLISFSDFVSIVNS